MERESDGKPSADEHELVDWLSNPDRDGKEPPHIATRFERLRELTDPAQREAERKQALADLMNLASEAQEGPVLIDAGATARPDYDPNIVTVPGVLAAGTSVPEEPPDRSIPFATRSE
jgi:hypothetical protein